MKSEKSLERKLTRERTQLLLNQPFFGALCLRLKLVAGNVPTMATQSGSIQNFVRLLQPEELQAVGSLYAWHNIQNRRGRRICSSLDARTPATAAGAASAPAGLTVGPRRI